MKINKEKINEKVVVVYNKLKKTLKHPLLTYYSFRSKTQYNNNNYDAKKFDDNEKIINKIDEIIEARNLDVNKKENILKLINSINENHTVIGVSGQQGSGKSSVITAATKDIFLPKKGVLNIFAIVFLYIIKYFTPCIFLTRSRKCISRRIALRKWKYVNINLWSLFGQRNLFEYKDITNTAFTSEVSKTIDGKTNVFERISSFDKEKNKVSWIFIKKALWRAIFTKIKRINPFTFRLINSLFSSSYSVNAEKSKSKIVLMNLVSVLLISIFIYAILFMILYYTSGLRTPENAGISVASIFPASFFHILFKNSIKGIVVKEENDFFVDPISNIAIENYLKKASKGRIIILHISEIDRLFNEVGDSAFVRYIVESITMGYTARNINIIFEIDTEVENAISKEESFADTKNKLFKSMIYVRAFNLKSFTEYFGIMGNEKKLMGEYFKEIETRSYPGVKSWRAKDRHIKVFNNFIDKEYFTYGDESIIRPGFSKAFRPFAMDEFSQDWGHFENPTEIIMDEAPDIKFGNADENEEAKIGTFLMMVNPHLAYRTPWYTYQFLKPEYQKYFVERVLDSIKGIDAFSTKSLGHTVTNLPEDQLKKTFGKLKFSGIWGWNGATKTSKFDREKFFNKFPRYVKTEALEGFTFFDTMEGNEWVIDLYKANKSIFPKEAILALSQSEDISPSEYFNNVDFVLEYFGELTKDQKKEVLKLINSKSKLRKKFYKKLGINRNNKISQSDFESNDVSKKKNIEELISLDL